MPFIDSRLLVAVAAASLAACSESTTPGGSSPMTVSFSTAASTAGASASRSPISPSFDVTTTEGANTLVISKAQLVVARMELQQAGATCSSDADAGDDDAERAGHENECAELEVAPSIVDLPVTSAVVSGLSVSIPAGTYSALEAKVRAIHAGRGHGSSAFLTAHPDFADVSVRVEGTYNTHPFVYIGSPTAQLETQFATPLVATTDPVNLTVNVDLSSWFRDASGALIDPSTANPNGVNAAVVANNIRRSFRAFRDNDRNGHDDDHEGGH